MSGRDRKPWASATVLSQAVLDASQDNLVNGLEAIVEIEAPDGSIIRASDRNKYVGQHFYEALTNFPVISRTLGEWLSSGLEFSELEFELSNADGRFNRFLPGGADFAGWVGRAVTVKIGLAETASTYTTVFRGRITRDGGFGRTVKSIIIRARDELERVAKAFPTETFSDTAYPKAAQDLWGTLKPIIYGDWTVNVTPGSASVFGYVVNGADIFVSGEEINAQVAVGTPAIFTYVNHRLDVGQVVNISSDTLPAGVTAGDYTVAATNFNSFTLTGVDASGAGEVKVKKPDAADRLNVQCVVSANANEVLDTSNVYLKRQDKRYRIPAAQVVNLNGSKNAFEIIQNQASFTIEGANWTYDKEDVVLVRLRGKNLGAYDGNAVAIARDILETYGGVTSPEFDGTWATYRNKASPVQSAVANIKARAWIHEEQQVLTYVKSLLGQVRLELFVDRDLQFKVSSLHFEDWDATPAFIIRNWDCEKGSFTPRIDTQGNFNRSRGAYNELPDIGEMAYFTPYFRNNAAISQAGIEITQLGKFPNLHDDADAARQVKETLKLASAYREVIQVNLTSRAFLQDVGGFVTVQVVIGSTVLDGVPCLIRELGYDPGSLKISAKLWSFAMVPFTGWSPGYAGTVGGQTATITQE